MTATIILCVVSAILLIPQLYVGIKGIKISNNPDSSKGHIVWAIIFGVISVAGIFSPISSLTQSGDVVGDVIELANRVLDVIIYFAYARYAIKVSKSV